jgi:hypothetical protein
MFRVGARGVDVDKNPNEWNMWLESSSFARHLPVKDFVGLSEVEAKDAAAALGISRVRTIVLDRPVEKGVYRRLTTDRRPARLNLTVVSGRVVRAAYF